MACTRPDAPQAEQPPAATLVGKWVQVFPAHGALDTLELHADGRVSGATVGLDLISNDWVHDHWRIGSDLMPGGFCIGEEKPTPPYPKARFHCQGYKLLGDTLWLANENRAAFLRLPVDGRRVEIAAWSRLHGAIVSPRATESVAPPPPDVRIP